MLVCRIRWFCEVITLRPVMGRRVFCFYFLPFPPRHSIKFTRNIGGDFMIEGDINSDIHIQIKMSFLLKGG